MQPDNNKRPSYSSVAPRSRFCSGFQNFYSTSFSSPLNVYFLETIWLMQSMYIKGEMADNERCHQDELWVQQLGKGNGKRKRTGATSRSHLKHCSLNRRVGATRQSFDSNGGQFGDKEGHLELPSHIDGLPHLQRQQC